MAAYTEFDALQWLCRFLKTQVEWVTDGIGGSMCGDDHGIELDALDHSLMLEMRAVMEPIVGTWGTYSDGRKVTTHVEIESFGHYTHLWHPDPSRDKPRTLTGQLARNHPDEDRGHYEIEIIPPQTLTVRTFPKAPRPALRSV